jgi:mRNA turnover protein 4
MLDQFPPSMESQLRALGLQIKLDNGKYYMLSDYVVCEEGKALTPEQTKMIVSNFFI